jgi:hypothetical protein
MSRELLNNRENLGEQPSGGFQIDGAKVMADILPARKAATTDGDEDIEERRPPDNGSGAGGPKRPISVTELEGGTDLLEYGDGTKVKRNLRNGTWTDVDKDGNETTKYWAEFGYQKASEVKTDRDGTVHVKFGQDKYSRAESFTANPKTGEHVTKYRDGREEKTYWDGVSRGQAEVTTDKDGKATYKFDKYNLHAKSATYDPKESTYTIESLDGTITVEKWNDKARGYGHSPKLEARYDAEQAMKAAGLDLDKVKADMDKFEKQAFRVDVNEAQIARVYADLAAIIKGKPNGLSPAIRAQVARDLLHTLAEPSTVSSLKGLGYPDGYSGSIRGDVLADDARKNPLFIEFNTPKDLRNLNRK